MEFDSLEKIVTDLPIFGSFSIKFFDGDAKNDNFYNELKECLLILFFTHKIHLKCIECKHHYPFSVSHTITKNGIDGSYCYGAGWKFSNLDNEEFFRNSIILPKEDEGVIEYTFKCTMSPNRHYQKMYLLYTLNQEGIVFRKIGQKPLNSDLKSKMSNDYKKILEKYDAFDDFRSFEQSESRFLLAGSCTYLRRILEKMVNTMFNSLNLSEEEKNNCKHFDEKLDLVKDQFETGVQSVLDNSYSLLSKGIHELSNKEIESFYLLMLEVICTQLEFENEKEENEAKRKALKQKIDLASSKYKK